MEKKEKLTKTGRKAVRERIAMKLKDIDFDPNHRIKLSLEDLEDLLFEKEPNKPKEFAFFYEGLCKLDLSEVSLKGVNLESKHKVDLSDTNLDVDLNIVRRWNSGYNISIRNINFNNVDLSKNFPIRHNITFDNCELKNTGIKLSKIGRNLWFKHCDLSDNDFSDQELHCVGFRFQKGYEYRLITGTTQIVQCNLSNTKAIIKPWKKGTFTWDVSLIHDPVRTDKHLGRLMAKGFLKGCTIKGRKIKPMGMKNDKRKKQNYSRYTSDKINGLLDTIEAQLSGYNFGGRMAKDAVVPQSKKEESKKIVLATTPEQNAGSFYGCDNVPVIEDPKEDECTGVGSFYGCGNVPPVAKPTKKKELTVPNPNSPNKK